MYAITPTPGAWVKASPNAAKDAATTANSGNPISVKALAQLPDATLVTLGVRRLDNTKAPTSSTQFQTSVEGPIIVVGNRCQMTWTLVDQELNQAKQEAARAIENIADAKRTENVELNLGGTTYSFSMDADSTHKYTMLGAALASGVTYPAEGISFVVYVNDVRQRLRINSEQWTTVVKTMATKLIQIGNREDALLTSVNTAITLNELRQLNINEGWSS
jgi:hypothetical protein